MMNEILFNAPLVLVLIECFHGQPEKRGRVALLADVACG